MHFGGHYLAFRVAMFSRFLKVEFVFEGRTESEVTRKRRRPWDQRLMISHILRSNCVLMLQQELPMYSLKVGFHLYRWDPNIKVESYLKRLYKRRLSMRTHGDSCVYHQQHTQKWNQQYLERATS